MIAADIKQLLDGKRAGGLTAKIGGLRTNFVVVLNLLGSSLFKRRMVDSQVLQQLKILLKLVESPFQGRDDFVLELLRVFERITEEASVMEEHGASFVEILPSLSIVCQGSRDGDARFLCVKIWFEAVVNMLNEAPKNSRRVELKSLCADHFEAMLPILMKDEDPTPVYAQKLLQMLVEFNVIVR